MDDALGIEINRRALLRIVAVLVAMLRVGDVLTRGVHLSILSVMLPAESAVRRLIAMLAHGIIVTPMLARAAPIAPIPRGSSARTSVFPLFDRRKRVGPVEQRVPGRGPGIRPLDGTAAPIPQTVVPMLDDLVDATRVRRRLDTLLDVLGDMPKQAKRLARIIAGGKAKFLRVMRPGRPPGHRARRRHPVDEVLADCHGLALHALNRPVRAPPLS